jgi:hypothetical protein
MDDTCRPGWQSNTALIRYPDFPQIDFSTAAAGSMNGHLDILITGGQWLFDSHGTVEVARTVSSASGPTLTHVASGTVSSVQVIGPSCR